MAKICRTCTETVITNDYFYLNGTSYISDKLRVRDLINSCIPDLSMDFAFDSVICRNCTSALVIGYLFKTEIIKRDQMLQNQQKLRNKDDNCYEKNEIFGGELLSNSFSAAADVENEQTECIENEFIELQNVMEWDYEKDKCIETIKLQEEYENISEESLDIKAETMKLDNGNNVCFQTEKLIKDSKYSNTKYIENEPCKASLQPNFDDPDKNSSNEIGRDVNITVTEDTRSHIEFRNSIKKRKLNIKRPYSCNLCSFNTDSRSSLLLHTRIHTGEKPFHCSICPYKAKRKAHLDEHIKIHTGERPFKCNVCSKGFISKHILRKHLRIHSEKKPYHCNHCNYGAKKKSSITNHVQKVHSGVTQTSQSCVCSVCGKCLATRCSLKSHMKTHTGVKSHLCELCGTYFCEKRSLKNHMRVHIGEKPFKCTKCDYIATRKAHLQDHMRSYGNHDKLFECETCKKCYATSVLLCKHKHEEHEIQKTN